MCLRKQGGRILSVFRKVMFEELESESGVKHGTASTRIETSGGEYAQRLRCGRKNSAGNCVEGCGC